ncbi:TetR/AcrR family transcriptional regulator [Spongiactinospora sp. TRM90649]|uniref:TetR/AcrR family transcriptional regulator n=1 Tax=Spongiactinospora sp. TRM90649 TaxID=3031114 RepID=UPI0023F779E2|nr:TetR/AcrR family transcriptional regulator [Spongiactinospora sp. TRM90649]MDF5751897.1 helix-turn-helix domain containing protein [Spongiactinospora sp. TRM90649]
MEERRSPRRASGPARRADAMRNSGRIIQAAIAALRDEGPGVSLDEIARRAGVGVATVYRRFGDRDGVIRAAFESYFADEVEPLVLAAGADADPRHGLAGALAAVVDTMAAHRVLLAAARESGAFTVEIAERFMGPLGDLLAAAQRRGLVRSDLITRDLAAIVVMALATARDDDTGAAPRRYLALLLDGTRPSPDPLPAPPSTSPLGGPPGGVRPSPE